MSRIRRVTRRAVLATLGVAALVGLTSTAAAGADGEYVKYYAVASSYQGKPENLDEIAGRFLGAGSRSAELFSLNSGRPQPGGGALTDPAQVRAGWVLVLPWDAYGAGVRYGVLPGKSPSTAGRTPTNKPSKNQPPTPGNNSGGATTGTKAPGKPSDAGKPAKPRKPGDCAIAAASNSRSDWAGLRLAADQAWPQSRGKGQLIAVVDSGVDGTLPQLGGHVALGSDVIAGSGRGDTDCLGTGTAMAGLIAAQPAKGSGVTGIAPDATILPIRVVGARPKASAADGAAAIGAAVAAGATVIAVGSYVDLNETEVAEAVNAATDKGVVVVAGAPLGSAPVNPRAPIGDGVLRVGGIGMDGQAAADYLKGGIDVVAPGVNVSSIGITGAGPVAGSGTQYAVALAAGQVALVRSAYPDLSPKQIKHRVEKTAESMGGKAPDAQYGWGLISPAASVTEVLPEEAGSPSGKSGKNAARSAPSGRSETTLLVIVVLVALVAATLLALRIKRLLRPDDPFGRPQEPDERDSDDPPPPPVASDQHIVGLPAKPGGGLRRPDTETADDEASSRPASDQARAKDGDGPVHSAIAAGVGTPDATARDKAAAGAKSTGARSADE